MSRTLLIGVCLSAALAACASAPQNTHTASNAACKNAVPGPLSPGQCKSYSGEELQRTGEENVGDALGKLDPTVTIQHH